MKEVSSTKEGRLNTKDCLHALALLRRAKWFQVIQIQRSCLPFHVRLFMISLFTGPS